jgi:hypothetical protein
MVAVRILQSRGLARKIGILDLDMHYGNGTADILERLKVADVHHYTFGAHYGTPEQGEAFIEELPRILAGFAGCELVLYQAGADSFVDDPLGGVLTMPQLRMRDRLVFRHFAAAKTPLVWDLAAATRATPPARSSRCCRSTTPPSRSATRLRGGVSRHQRRAETSGQAQAAVLDVEGQQARGRGARLGAQRREDRKVGDCRGYSCRTWSRRTPGSRAAAARRPRDDRRRALLVERDDAVLAVDREVQVLLVVEGEAVDAADQAMFS